MLDKVANYPRQKVNKGGKGGQKVKGRENQQLAKILNSPEIRFFHDENLI